MLIVHSSQFTVHSKKENGFTLIELMLTVALSSILFAVIAAFLVVFFQARVKNETMLEVEQQGLQIMQIMTQTTRNAEAILVPPSGAVAQSLSLDVVELTEDPIVFDLSNGVLRIQEGGAAPHSLTNTRVSVSHLSFSNLSSTGTPGTIRISFTLSHVNTTGRNEYAFSKTFTHSATLRQP